MTPSAENEPHRADLHKDPAQVSGMFDEVAKGYDRTNTVLSMGNDRLWRVATTRAVDPRRGQRILDLAAGTGASSVALDHVEVHVDAARLGVLEVNIPGDVDVRGGAVGRRIACVRPVAGRGHEGDVRMPRHDHATGP